MSERGSEKERMGWDKKRGVWKVCMMIKHLQVARSVWLKLIVLSMLEIVASFLFGIIYKGMP